MIRIKNLSKTYGKNQVLKQINIAFEYGKVYGIVGENGSGKTTLFRCIAGLENYDGEIVSEYKCLKDEVGLLLTEPFFFPRLTGKEYIQLLLSARGVKGTDIEGQNIFDLPLNDYASSYSTGMKKKLALTAVLLQKNDVLILDEPFNGVDIQSNMVIVELIKTLKGLGKTVIISSHIFSTLSDTCNEIHVLKEGAFERCVYPEDYHVLETEMKALIVGDVMGKLDLN